MVYSLHTNVVEMVDEKIKQTKCGLWTKHDFSLYSLALQVIYFLHNDDNNKKKYSMELKLKSPSIFSMEFYGFPVSSKEFSNLTRK